MSQQVGIESEFHRVVEQQRGASKSASNLSPKKSPKKTPIALFAHSHGQLKARPYTADAAGKQLLKKAVSKSLLIQNMHKRYASDSLVDDPLKRDNSITDTLTYKEEDPNANAPVSVDTREKFSTSYRQVGLEWEGSGMLEEEEASGNVLCVYV